MDLNYVFKAGASVVKIYGDEITVNFPAKKIKIEELTGASWKAGTLANGKFTLIAGDKTVVFYFKKKQNKEAEEFFNIIAPIINKKVQEESPEQFKFWNTFNALPCKDLFGTKKEVNYLSNIMQSEEELKALTSGLMEGNTWLIACTNRRVIFLDNGLIYGLKQMEIPIRNINSINQKQGLVFGEIHIQDGASNRKIENIDKSTISFFVQTVNEQIQLSFTSENHQNVVMKTETSNLDEIKKLKELLDIGAINQDEFEIKKKELLGL